VCQGKRIFGLGGHASSCRCGCMPFHRRFISTKEEQELLEEYRNQLKKEMEGVEESLGKLGSK